LGKEVFDVRLSRPHHDCLYPEGSLVKVGPLARRRGLAGAPDESIPYVGPERHASGSMIEA